MDKGNYYWPVQVQWDPEHSIDEPEPSGRMEPRKLLSARAIQIGINGPLSQFFASNVLSISDVTHLAHEVYEAHSLMRKRKLRGQGAARMAEINERLPVERPYLPGCEAKHLVRLGMLPGAAARHVAQLGRGKVA